MSSVIILSLLFLFVPDSLLAQPVEYTLAAPLPGGGEKANDFIQYMSFLFPFLLSVAAIGALVVFVYGGIEYASSGGSEDRVKNAKERISNALLGLLLAVGSVLIMQTINPELIKLNIQLENVGVKDNVSGCPADPAQRVCGSSCYGKCADPDQKCLDNDNDGNYSCELFTPPPCDPAHDGNCTQCTPQEIQSCINTTGAALCSATIINGTRAPVCQGNP